MFDFFTGIGVRHVAFNIEESAGANRSATYDVADVRGLARAFFRRYFERVAKFRGPHWVRELGGVIDSLRKHAGVVRSQASRPGAILSVDARGRVSTFSPELLTWSSADPGRFQFADLTSQPLAAMWEADRFKQTLRSIDEGWEACRQSCSYFRFCGGGAPCAKLAELGTFAGATTLYCETKLKASVDAVLDLVLDGDVDFAGPQPELFDV
jgi:uncharacterized protein